MQFTSKTMLSIIFAMTVMFQSTILAAEPEEPITGVVTEVFSGQSMEKLPVRVIDKDGQPIANAKVTPWAIRCSQGHGSWAENDKETGVGPKEVVTDAEGNAVVLYPLFRHVDERIRTTGVSLTIDHPEFAIVNDIHVDVPHELKDPFHITLGRGISAEIRPVFDESTTETNNLFFVWSDGRSYKEGFSPEQLAHGNFRIPAMPPGNNSVLVVKMKDEHATHFSKITDFKLDQSANHPIEVRLKPSVRIEGVLSPNVPRPIRNGRIKSWTLDPAHADGNRVSWFTWAPIENDGTFVINGWPADEPMQLIALCDGYIAASGRAPESVENPVDPTKDPFQRPQVFSDFNSKPIEVSMEALVRCEIDVKDEDDKPVAGIKIASWPNVCWWNSGSQIYCHPLVRGENRLRTRSYEKSIDKQFPIPFQTESNAQGKATLQLPAGNESLIAESDLYELPAFLGRRDVKIKLVRNQTTDVTLTMQPKGTEKLGEWDKLAGVVFGCSTREGRRICALPGVQKKMDEFAVRFRNAKNKKDPQLLSEAYAVVAEAFENAGDIAESAKWRQKAMEQAQKAKTKIADQ